MQIHFISDLHLSADRPGLVEIFERYLAGPARQAHTLYILGDFFEYWAGDDDLEDPLNTRIAQGLAALAESGCEIRFMAGNRDFLIGADFAARARLTLLPDPSTIQLGEQTALLCHGDALCTDDLPYQAFRQQVRNPAWQAHFLGQPLAVRKQIIAGARMQSEAAKSGKASEIMDINADALAALLRAQGLPPLIIHGHTHRPATHPLTLDGQPIERWVLTDWHDDQGEVLIWEAGALRREKLS